MKKFIVLIVFICVQLISFGQAKYEWKTATASGYTYKYVSNDPTKSRFYQLENGLTVILTANQKEPRISYRMAVRSGSNDDPANHTGLAHYLEHLLFKGTDKYGSLDWTKEKPLLDKIESLYEQYTATTDPEKRKEIYKEIDKISGEASKFSIAGEYTKMMQVLGSQATNAHTSVEETIYEEDIPSNAVDQFLIIQAERFRFPVLRIFHTELEAVYEEKNRGIDNDANKMQEAMFSTVFPTHNYGLQTTIGTIEHLKNPSIIAIRDFYNSHYVPNNMAIIMSGDFDPDILIKKIDVRFSYMKRAPFNEYKGTIEKPLDGPIVKEIFGPTSESVRILFRTGPTGSRDELLTSLIGSVFSNGKAGLLDLNLNKQQKLIGAGAAAWQFKDYGIFFLLASPKQGQTVEQVKDLLMEQINILKKGEFDESLIKAVAANYKLNQFQSLEDNTYRVNNLADDFIKSKGNNWDKVVSEIDEINKITKKELVEFAQKFFGNNNYVVLYKRKGEDKTVVKVDKPPITPVETNAGKSSPFVKHIIETRLGSIKPVWVDYEKDLKKATLGNAEMLYVPNKENSLFRLSYRFDMGSWNNKLLPYAGQYLQYLNTGKYSAEQISKEFYYLACNYNINVGTEQTTINISGIQENFGAAVSLLEHILANCKPDEAALAGFKNLIQKSRANAKLNKGTISQGIQQYAMYGPQNPFNYVLTNAQVQEIKPEELTNLLNSLTSYKHTITYYGPLQLTELVKNLKTLHPMPATWKENTAAIKFIRTQQTSPQVLFTNYEAVQSEIYWIRNLGDYDPKSEALINIFNNYFGGGMGSVVFQTIRESKALAYSTYSGVLTPSRKEDKFSIVAYVGSQADKTNDAIAGMNELLNDLPKTQSNFDNATGSLRKDIETDRITKEGIINNYLNAKRKGIDYDLRKENYEKYNSIRLDDIYKFHQNQLSKKPYTYCIIASDKKVNVDDLRKLGDVKVLGTEELFGY